MPYLVQWELALLYKFFDIFFRSFTLDEILAILEEESDNDVDEIVLFPPEDKVRTDEDSASEEEAIIDNLPGPQLRATAEIRTRDDSEWDEEDCMPLSQVREMNRKRPRIDENYVWQMDADLHVPANEWEEISVKRNLSPFEYFSFFFCDALINLFVENTNKYAASKNLAPTVTSDEICCFFGILLLSGYTSVSKRRLYWESSPDTRNDLIASAMSRNRFEFIMSNLHCCDNNNLNENDKFSKVRPLFDLLNTAFVEHAPLQRDCCVDEAMVPYFGRHGTKQFIRGKPIRWGYKLWVGASSGGYIAWFDPYQGADPTSSGKSLGLGAKVVSEFCNVIQKRHPKIKFHVYFDNFFTSLDLLRQLNDQNLHATGTIRSNRLKNCPLKI